MICALHKAILVSSRKNDEWKATINLHFLIPQRTKIGVMKELLFWGLGFSSGFFGLHCMRPTIFTYWRLVRALNCLLHTIWHGKAAGQTLSYLVSQWNEIWLIYSSSGFSSFLCLCKITWRLPSLMLKSTAFSLGARGPLRYCPCLGFQLLFRTADGGEQVISLSN